jgi:hypothetical protein
MLTNAQMTRILVEATKNVKTQWAATSAVAQSATVSTQPLNSAKV